MKKEIIKSFSFFLLLIITFSLFSIWLTSQKPLDGLEGEQPNQLDYLVMGDSECRHSFSPMEVWNSYGYAGYNCGMDAQQIQEAYYQLEKILYKQSPKVILLETNLLYRDEWLIQEAQTSFDHLLGEALPLYRDHNLWKQMLSFASLSSGKKNAGDIFKGLLYTRTVTPYTKGTYVTETDQVLKIGTPQLIYLDRFVKRCKKEKIQLVLYSAPSPLNWHMAKHNGVAAYANKNNLNFLDLNLKIDELGIDWENDTYDKGDHLNLAGAIKVSNYLGKFLNEHFSLPDHRGDAAYSGWNDCLQAYLRQIAS